MESIAVDLKVRPWVNMILAVVHEIKSRLNRKTIDRGKSVIIIDTKVESWHAAVHHFVGIGTGKGERSVTAAAGRPFLVNANATDTRIRRNRLQGRCCGSRSWSRPAGQGWRHPCFSGHRPWRGFQKGSGLPCVPCHRPP